MKVFDEILERKDELLFDDEKWKESFLEIVPEISAYFDGIKIDEDRLRDGFERFLYNKLKFTTNTGTLSDLDAMGCYDRSTNEISLPKARVSSKLKRYNQATLCHEFMHFVKATYNPSVAPTWMEEMIVESLAIRILNKKFLCGYDKLSYYLDVLDEKYEKMNFADFFNNNLKNYLARVPETYLAHDLLFGQSDDEDEECSLFLKIFDQNTNFVSNYLLCNAENLILDGEDNFAKFLTKILASNVNLKYDFCDNGKVNMAYAQAIRDFFLSQHFAINPKSKEWNDFYRQLKLVRNNMFFSARFPEADQLITVLIDGEVTNVLVKDGILYTCPTTSYGNVLDFIRYEFDSDEYKTEQFLKMPMSNVKPTKFKMRHTNFEYDSTKRILNAKDDGHLRHPHKIEMFYYDIKKNVAKMKDNKDYYFVDKEGIKKLNDLAYSMIEDMDDTINDYFERLYDDYMKALEEQKQNEQSNEDMNEEDNFSKYVENPGDYMDYFEEEDDEELEEEEAEEDEYDDIDVFDLSEDDIRNI